MPPKVPLLCRIVLASLEVCFFIWNWVRFFQGLWRILLRFWWALHWICRLLCRFLLPKANLTKITMFTMLILLTQEHRRSFNFLVTSSISFFKDLKFLWYKSSTCLDRVTPKYFMLFVAIVKGDASLISFSSHLSSVYRKATDFFFELVLYPSTLLKSVYEL